MLTILRDTIAPSAVRMSDQRSVIWPMRCVCHQARPPRRYRECRSSYNLGGRRGCGETDGRMLRHRMLVASRDAKGFGWRLDCLGTLLPLTAQFT